MTQPDLLLYDASVSSYCQKARIALREKGLKFDKVMPMALTEGGIPDADWLKANPRAEVPTLAVTNDTEAGAGHENYHVTDSRLICEWLDDRFPDKKSLLPKDPRLRVKARRIEMVIDTQYEAVNWGWGEVYWMKRADGALAEHIKAETIRQTKELQDWLETCIEPSGWLTGPDFGLADAATAPIVHRSTYYGFPPASGSKLEAWLHNVRQWPSVKETLKEFDESADNMAKLSPLFLSGKKKREYRDYRLEYLIKSGGLSIVLDGLKNDNIRFPWPEGRRE